MKIADIMTRSVVSVEPSATILQAIRLMLQNRISGLAVVDKKGDLVGIVTEGDFLRRSETETQKSRPRWLQFLVGSGKLANEYVQANGRKVDEIMTRSLHTVTEETSLADAVELMERFRVKRLPVLQGRKLVGIVSRANFLRALASVAREVNAPTPSDADIQKKLIAELTAQKWALPSMLNIVVRNGVVDLWGTITDERVRPALIVAAENIPGVKSVRDHLAWVEPVSGIVIGDSVIQDDKTERPAEISLHN